MLRRTVEINYVKIAVKLEKSYGLIAVYSVQGKGTLGDVFEWSIPPRFVSWLHHSIVICPCLNSFLQ